ncbi:M48 family metalloprotease [Streptomyces sp. NPDC058001]|uniref:M48 family metalloprotease n=1 Tax=Streptomyces sp. NPDC058001 TaxID=3346300 RepID=UPI0036ED4D4F
MSSTSPCRPATLDIREFPSDLSLMLGLLVVTVLTQDLFFALLMTSTQEIGSIFGYLMSVLLPGFLTGMHINRRRWRRSTPLAEAPFHGAIEAVQRLVQEAGLSKEPSVMVDPRLRSGAYVTTLGSHPLMMLGPELLALREKGERGRQIFEAVVRHELAHLQGADHHTYFWLRVLRLSNLYTGAFMVYGATLDALGHNVSPWQLFAAVVRVVLLTVLGELIARAYLRIREHHADLHAGLTDREGLLAALHSETSGANKDGTGKLRSWLRHHPMDTERVGVAEAPGRVLASSRGRVFLGSTVAGVLLPTLLDMQLRLSPNLSAMIVCEAIAGAGLTLFVGFTLWRHQWYAGTAGLARSAATAALVAAGMVTGSWLALYTRISDSRMSGFPMAPSVLVALLGATLLLCGWLTVLGAQWFRGDPRAERMPRFLKLAVPSACVVGGWLIAMVWTWAVFLQTVAASCSMDGYVCLSDAPERDVAAGMARLFGPGPVLVMVVLIAVGVPLAARFRSGMETSHGAEEQHAPVFVWHRRHTGRFVRTLLGLGHRVLAAAASIPRLRLWVRLFSMTALMVAIWLLLIPRTALYYVDDEGRPYDVRVVHSWRTTDRTLLLGSDLAGVDGPFKLVTSVRLDCGTAFAPGADEDARPGDGGEACSEVETPRRIIGLCLVGLCVVGLWGAPRLPGPRVPVGP